MIYSNTKIPHTTLDEVDRPLYHLEGLIHRGNDLFFTTNNLVHRLNEANDRILGRGPTTVPGDGVSETAPSATCALDAMEQLLMSWSRLVDRMEAQVSRSESI